MTLFTVAITNETSLTTTEHTVTASSEAEAIEALAARLKAAPACDIPFSHTSFFCGNPACPS